MLSSTNILKTILKTLMQNWYPQPNAIVLMTKISGRHSDDVFLLLILLTLFPSFSSIYSSFLAGSVQTTFSMCNFSLSSDQY